MQHIDRLGGKDEIEIDHFDPAKKNNAVQEYTNLFPACGHCNRSKSDTFNSSSGKRLLNPRKENDYNEQIFENHETGELIGTTSNATYHIIILDLNAPHLVKLRKRRMDLLNTINNTPVTVRDTNKAMRLYELMKQEIETMIPFIKSLPQKNEK